MTLALAHDAVVPSVVLNLGMGVDSAAILTRYLLEPDSRDFDLREMVVVTAQTGDEWSETGELVERHLLPLLRKHDVRLVQVARSQLKTSRAGDGVVVLDDSRQSQRVYLDGSYKLSEEMLTAGTIPLTGSKRLCSVHAKGNALDPVVAALTRGRPFRQILGFECSEREVKRADKDAGYNTPARTGAYPLIEWGWNRQTCSDYLTRVFGVEWLKSACTFCPFALTNKESRERTVVRFGREPERGVLALYMEHLALALNENMGLVAGDRLIDLIAADPSLAHVLDALEARLDASPHALYEVRRVLREGPPARSIRQLRIGTRAEMRAAFEHATERARSTGLIVDTAQSGHQRIWRHQRGNTLPTIEHFLVVAPADAHDKEQPHFAALFKAVKAAQREAWEMELLDSGKVA